MTDFIMVPLIVGIVFLGIYKLFELFARRRERIMLIEKIGMNVDPSLVQDTLTFPTKSSRSGVFGTLKIACLLLGVGLGLLIGFFISNYYYGGIHMGDISDSTTRFMREMIGIIYGASTLLCGGLGLLIAFIVELKNLKKEA